MRLTIKAKLIGGFATVILLSGAMGGIAYTKLEEMAAAAGARSVDQARQRDHGHLR